MYCLGTYIGGNTINKNKDTVITKGRKVLTARGYVWGSWL